MNTTEESAAVSHSEPNIVLGLRLPNVYLHLQATEIMVEVSHKTGN